MEAGLQELPSIEQVVTVLTCQLALAMLHAVRSRRGNAEIIMLTTNDARGNWSVCSSLINVFQSLIIMEIQCTFCPPKNKGTSDK